MWKSLIFSSLLFTTTNLALSSLRINAQTETNNNPPAETYQPGFWQPVARVNMEKPISLNIINKTGVFLDYSFTDETLTPTVLRPDDTATIRSLNPENSIYLVIYPDMNNPNASRMSLKYSVEVTEDNVINLTVSVIEEISKGNRTFNLQPTGAIFLY
ncbi:hypothetical protein IQ215_01525 [Cyanobacterium stanieri LEGE 03274]|uniref:DUF2808 domain-containing protein n=1 Tax=Cyanobacterium stanieri LEGE 03274 TaxID=1828756 RepID=A0ABR9V0F4_9CHRO|nr:hypothetical protein [Cyanobacterium stanieri]MBE9221366.1 hypothetical protein [Cyanobacterium stanieri LEGE 03274]